MGRWSDVWILRMTRPLTTTLRSRRRSRSSGILATIALSLLVVASPAAAAGPPYPSPVAGQHVYDTAGVLSVATVAEAERIAGGIEARTGSRVVVYTQLKPESDTPTAAEADARALIDQWRIGRTGLDDGLVVLFDLDESLRHGQVQLYAGSGFDAAYLSASQRQTIFEDVMLPLLRTGDLDGALLASLQEIDKAATVDHAQALEGSNAVSEILAFLVSLIRAIFG